MTELLKRALKRGLSFLGYRRTPWDRSHQGSFRDNKSDIFNGILPERYEELSRLIPGRRILDVGSADGTLSLHLSGDRDFVYGLEPSTPRYKTALKLQEVWRRSSDLYGNCQFLNFGVMDRPEILADVDTVIFIRVLYHLGPGAAEVMKLIGVAANIRRVVLCGNRVKEERLERGEELAALGPHAMLATEAGMVQFLNDHDFEVEAIHRLETTGDCLLVGVRKPSSR